MNKTCLVGGLPLNDKPPIFDSDIHTDRFYGSWVQLLHAKPPFFNYDFNIDRLHGSFISRSKISISTQIAFMDHEFSSCLLNCQLWLRFLGKSQGLAKAKAWLSLFGCFGGPWRGPGKKEGRREEREEKMEGKKNWKIGLGCKLITKFVLKSYKNRSYSTLRCGRQ